MDDNPQMTTLGEWVLRVRRPPGRGPHPVLLLVHGWTGDENSMGIFASRLPADALLIAPRGLHAAPSGGFSWHPPKPAPWTVVDFRPSVEALLSLLTPTNFPEGDFSRLSLVGFSQGAALIYTFALLHPERVRSLAGLAGFMPQDAERLVAARPLQGMPAFVAHGTLDEQVPVAGARRAVAILEAAGADVSYCEDEVGHKLSLTCFKSLQAFFKDPTG